MSFLFPYLTIWLHSASAIVVESLQFCRCVTGPFTVPPQQSYSFFIQDTGVARMSVVSVCLNSEWMRGRALGEPFYKLHACHSEVDCLRRISELTHSVIKWQCQGSGSIILSSQKHLEPSYGDLWLCCLANHQEPSYLNSSRPHSEKLISVFWMISLHLRSITLSQDAPHHLHRLKWLTLAFL